MVQAGSTRKIKNFNDDIKDSDIYSDLIAQIAPKDAGVNKFAMKKDVSTTDNLKISTNTDILKDLTERAEMMLEQAEKIDSRAFVTARVMLAVVVDSYTHSCCRTWSEDRTNSILLLWQTCSTIILLWILQKRNLTSLKKPEKKRYLKSIIINIFT